MAVFGIIAEYNPFHNGHRLQVAKLRALDPDARFIAVMSGGFTQRGEAAVLNKWERARRAVENGLDLVLELPFAFAGRSAQFFAAGGVQLLARLGVVSTLAFGSELADLDALREMVKRSFSPAVATERCRKMRAGCSYAAAQAGAMAGGEDKKAKAIRQPNTILAVEYLKALRIYAPQMAPLVLPREQAAHHETVLCGEIASAAAIRQELFHSRPDWAKIEAAVPVGTLAGLRQQKKAGLPDMEQLSRTVLALLLTGGVATLREIYGMSEGLEHRFLAAAEISGSLRALTEAVRCKRYPASRIRRTFLCLLLSLSRDAVRRFDESGPLYARVLAFNDRGRGLLREIRTKGDIPLITRLRDCLPARRLREGTLSPMQEMLALDVHATGLWSLSLPSPGRRAMDFTTSPVYLPGG
ncbi:MAG: nucleotidyltransferase family protein [Schwartzia sp.]|nr:nucleotidyltransferase family protein [Schwartzia sp. (in: firmicutes)]